MHCHNQFESIYFIFYRCISVEKEHAVRKVNQERGVKQTITTTPNRNNNNKTTREPYVKNGGVLNQFIDV